MPTSLDVTTLPHLSGNVLVDWPGTCFGAADANDLADGTCLTDSNQPARMQYALLFGGIGAPTVGLFLNTVDTV
jgi:hypothetical protein